MGQLGSKFFLDVSQKKVIFRSIRNQRSFTRIAQNNPYNERLKDWIESEEHLVQQIQEYDWNYRKKICVNCTLEKRHKLNCRQYDNKKFGLPETHCIKLEKARNQKFSKKISKQNNFHPALQRFQKFI